MGLLDDHANDGRGEWPIPKMKTNYIDTELKLLLAKMLPEELYIHEYNTNGTKEGIVCDIEWKKGELEDCIVEDTELLHVCWLVEEDMVKNESHLYAWQVNELLATEILSPMERIYHASWQQRTLALAKVKGLI